MIKLTSKQYELAKKIVDVDSFISLDDLDGLIEAIDDYVMDTMDDNYDPSPTGIMYEGVRDDIVMYNDKDDFIPYYK